MAAQKFADSHKMVMFLEKPDESDGFEQIVDFLNAHTIKYALTINPTIYTLCIKQFWATTKVKTVNEEKQLQALVDRKKVVITESTIRRDLHLEDAEGTKCLPTATIFEELTRMGYEKLTHKLTFYKAFFSPQWKFLIHTILRCLSAKTTAWNEFSSTMASAIICLATNQKLNFSKYIFDNMVKNLEGGVKFLMYPRFVQREGKGFSGRVTPLFQTMMVQAHEEMGEGSEIPTDPHHRKDAEVSQPSSPTEPIADKAPNEESVPTHSNDPLLSGEDSIKLNELMELCTTLQSRVLALETTTTNQAMQIDSLKRRIKKLVKKASKRTHKLKRLYKVGLSAKVISSDDEGDEVIVESDVATKKKDDEVNVVKEVVSTVSDAASVSAATITTVELTLAQTLAKLKSARPKTTTTPTKTTIATTAATRGTRRVSIKEKSKLFQQLLEKRRKFFAAKRAEEKRNRPPTKAQKRSIMCTYLKNMAGWKAKYLKNKSFATTQDLFDKAMKKVNTFVDMDTELVEGSKKAEAEVIEESSSKRAGDELK
ncbi:hypothetical protein Tco_0390398 [Tanacetum coccineum]